MFGKLNNSHADSRHCWLVVKIRDNWYHIDPTFAIPETSEIICTSGVSAIKGADDLFYNYFCVDAETIKQNRTIEDENTLPICLNTIDFKKYQYIKVTPSRMVRMEDLDVCCLIMVQQRTYILLIIISYISAIVT